MTRLNKLLVRMDEENLSAFLITEPHNIFYLTNCWIQGALFLTPSKKFLITSPLYGEEVKLKEKEWEVVIYHHTLEEALKVVEKETKPKRCGFESFYLSYHQYQKLKDNWGGELVPYSHIVEEIRAVKDEEEVNLIRDAWQITKSTIDFLKGELRVGVTEEQIFNKAVNYIGENSSEISFPPIVLFGGRTSLPHGRPTARGLKKDDLVLLDLGAKIKGYCADLTTTLFFENVSDKWFQIHKLVSEAQKEGIAKIKPGAKSSQIDESIRKVMEKGGYLKYFLHGSGHGVGLQVHEEPFLKSNSGTVLKEGMVLAIEPGIYLPGEGGVRLEEMVLVTKEGGEVFNDNCQ